jgi:hypothetical protein
MKTIAGINQIEWPEPDPVALSQKEMFALAAYKHLHDAAPEDATKALVDLVRAVNSSVLDIGTANLAIQKLRATEAGAALIRQAETQDDAGE